jgi:hypothetical protein
MAYGTVNADVIGTSVANSNLGAGNATQFKNRIINGAMVIDQRNAGAAVTGNGDYPVDRFVVNNATDGAYSAQRDTEAPTGFSFSTKFTITTADTSLASTQNLTYITRIEGFNTADFQFGTANAKTVTLSFWVRSSLTGTFGGSLLNNANNRCYPFTYTISSANTWEQKSVTIAGDTSGTWVGATNGIGLRINFGLGAGSDRSGTAGAWNSNLNLSATGAVSVIGTLNATWYITGVQLEVGESATGFDYRPYGTELALCQRYYYKVFPNAVSKPLSISGYTSSTTSSVGLTQFLVIMRTTPTAIEQSGTANQYSIGQSSGSVVATGVPTYSTNLTTDYQAAFTVAATGLTANLPAIIRTDGTNGANAYLAWSAEL